MCVNCTGVCLVCCAQQAPPVPAQGGVARQQGRAAIAGADRDHWTFQSSTPTRLVEREATVSKFMDGVARAAGMHILLNLQFGDNDVEPLACFEKVLTDATLMDLVGMCNAELQRRDYPQLTSADEFRIFIGTYLRSVVYNLNDDLYDEFRARMWMTRDDGAKVLMMDFKRLMQIKSCLRLTFGLPWHRGDPDPAATADGYREALYRPLERTNPAIDRALAATRTIVCSGNNIHVTTDDNSVSWSGAVVPGRTHGAYGTPDVGGLHRQA